jgi:hypothetical protein
MAGKKFLDLFPKLDELISLGHRDGWLHMRGALPATWSESARMNLNEI